MTDTLSVEYRPVFGCHKSGIMTCFINVHCDVYHIHISNRIIYIL